MLDPLRRAGAAVSTALTLPARLADEMVTEPVAAAVAQPLDGPGGEPATRHRDDGATDGSDGSERTGLAELLDLVDDGTGLLEGVVEEGVDLIEDTLGRHRRIWEDDDRDHAQIEVPAIADPAAVGLRQRLAQGLSRVEGVRWAEVNAITSRVAVAFDGGESTLSALVELIESIEDSAGATRDERRPGWDTEERADHPADDEPIHRTIAILTGDVASLGWTAIGRAARVARLPVEAAGLISIVDNNPWLRLQAQRLLGQRAAALALPLASAAASGISQGPFGTIVDLGLQSAVLEELRARKQAWERREPEFYAVHSDTPIDPPALEPRATALPAGPIESWSRWSAGLGLAAAGVSLAATRDPRLSTDLVISSMPKAARLGREGFAAGLGRTLAKRGVVPLDGSALRRLDRIDTVVLDSDVLLRPRPSVRAVIEPGGRDVDAGVLWQVTERLFDPDAPTAPANWRSWRLADVGEVDREVMRAARGATTRAREVRAGAGTPLALLQDGRLRAIVDVGHELDPVIDPVIDAIREAGLRFVVADGDGRTAGLLAADERVRTGDALGDDVRRLQDEGHGVMVIGRQGHRGLAAADVGVGVAAATGRPSWGADLILGRELADAATIIRASAIARAVSRRSTQFAMGGSALGALVVLTGSQLGAASRALAVVNGAAGGSLVSGLWEAVQLSHEPRPRSPDRSRWHVLPVDRVVEQLGSDAARGLSSEEVSQRRVAQAEFGSEISPLEPFLAELANPLNPVLGVGAGLSAATGSMTDASLVLGLIGVNTVVGGVQRLRADRTVRRLLEHDVEDVVVVRDGHSMTVHDDDLVPGDVITLLAGDAVPADARIIESDGCEVDESGLTGESLPVSKEAEPAPDVELADRTCMLYEDTTVVAGSARAIVVATGHATEVARSLALSGPPPRTGVELRLEELTRRLLPAALGVAGTTGAIGLLRRWPLQEVTGTAVSLAIASVPEGLPFVATAGQLAGARRLAAHGAVVRNPRTVEALGRVDVLCVDKTGTLTDGRVALVAVSDGLDAVNVEELDGSMGRVLVSAVLASDQPGDDGRGLAELDDADRALHHGMAESGWASSAMVTDWTLIDDLPFEASRGMHAVLGREGRQRVILAKGAPETLLELCTHRDTRDGRVALDAEGWAAVAAHVDQLARRGHRLLAVARRVVDRDVEQVDADEVADLDLLGLVVLADPVRPTAAAAVRGIGQAGVRTIMVTGDHPETAASIAHQLRLTNGHDVLVGQELAELSDEQLAERLDTTTVVARVSPADKQRIVQVLQGAGHVVAMTGDGANDAAAIRLAQVGVALGQRSSSAAREAADIVIADDRVETLIDAIAEGRALWGSIREALGVLVGGNLGEIGFTALASAFSDGAPLQPRQFLLVNLFTDLAPAVAIAVRPPDDVSPQTLLQEGPDRSLGSALRRDITVRGTATAAGAMGAWSAARLTGTQGRAGTVGLAALVGSQLGQTLIAGGWRRPTTLVTVAGSAAFFVGAVQTPGVSHFFGSRPIGPVGWSQALTASALATVGSEVATRALRRLDELAAGTDDEAAVSLVRAEPRSTPVIELTERPARVLVTGAHGPVGRALVDRLHTDGHEVVTTAGRDAVRRDDAGRPPTLDLDDVEQVTSAARGCAVVIHLEAALGVRGRELDELERARATNLARATDLAGTARVVHLGGLLDEERLHREAPVLHARAAAAAELRAGPVPVMEVRCGPVLGVRGRLHELLRGVARLPLDLDHPMLDGRTQPVAVDDLAAVLARLASGREPHARVLEIAGPEVTTYRALIESIRAHEGRARMIRPRVRRVPPDAASAVLARTAGLDQAVVSALLSCADSDMIVRDPVGRERYGDLLATTPDAALAALWHREAAAS